MRTLLAVGALALLVAAPSSSEVLNLFGLQPAQAANSAPVTAEGKPTVAADLVLAKLPEAEGQPVLASPNSASVQVAALDPKAALQPAPSGEPARDLWLVNASSLNLRNGPSTGAGVIGRLVQDTKVKVTRQADGWMFVTTDSGKSGWISSKFLTRA